MTTMAPEIAVVTHNTDYYLLNLLDSLAPLHAQNAIGAVHVWDNASSDLTTRLLEAYGSRHAWVRPYRSATNVYHGPALDALVRDICRSEWVLVLDSDTEVRLSLPQALAALPIEGAAFVGQVHPQMPHLYAYLAHLLVHRPTYLTLPPFRHDGAPGTDYFQAVERQRRPFVRFRWSDHVRHFGQGALRRLVERGDRANAFYAFARRLEQADPRAPERLTLEQNLQSRLDRFVQDAPDGLRSLPAATQGSTPARRHPGTSAPRHPGTSAPRNLDWLSAPRLSHWLREARRMGLTQIRGEVLSLMRLLRERPPRRVLEIGSAHGGSFLLWARVAHRDATLVSVDLPPWELDDPAEPVKKRRLAAVGSAGQHVHVIRGNSHDRAIRDAVSQCFAGEPIDFLFIDGDHSFEGVAADFSDYSPLVSPGGMIALHDIHPHSKGWGGDVPALWRTLRRRYRHTELVADPHQDGFGIGVIWI